MQDSYLDEEKKRRYDVLRTRKNRCEMFYDRCMIGALAATVLESAFNYFFMFRALGSGVLLPVICFNLDIGLRICEFLGLFRRRRILTVCAGIPVALSMSLPRIFSSLPKTMYPGTLVVLIALLWTQLQWEQLAKEEGFPNFELDLREVEQSKPDYHPELAERPLPVPEPVCTEAPIVRRGGPEDMDTI